MRAKGARISSADKKAGPSARFSISELFGWRARIAGPRACVILSNRRSRRPSLANVHRRVPCALVEPLCPDGAIGVRAEQLLGVLDFVRHANRLGRGAVVVMQHNSGFIDFEEHESAGGPIGAGQEALAQLTSHDYTGRIGLLKAMRGVVIGIGGRRSDQREGKARGVRFSSVHFLVFGITKAPHHAATGPCGVSSFISARAAEETRSLSEISNGR